MVDLEKAFNVINLKGMKKSFNKRYVKHDGNVNKTNNYLRNVILGKDGESKRFARPGDGEPLYIMENGRLILRNTDKQDRKKHQTKKSIKISTQQQWTTMIKKRYWRNKLKELRRQEINHNSNHITYGKLMNHLNITTAENQSTTKTH